MSNEAAKVRDPVLDEIFGLPGISKVKVARACGISKAAVGQWRRVPVEHVRTVHALLKGRIPLKRLRADVYDAAFETGGTATVSEQTTGAAVTA